MENDGKKYDCGKVRMDLVPLDVVENIGKVLTYGAQKYQIVGKIFQIFGKDIKQHY